MFGAGCRCGFPHDCLRPADGQSPAIRNDNLQFSVVFYAKKDRAPKANAHLQALPHKLNFSLQTSQIFADAQRTER